MADDEEIEVPDYPPNEMFYETFNSPRETRRDEPIRKPEPEQKPPQPSKPKE